jgi:hypothetical protein
MALPQNRNDKVKQKNKKKNGVKKKEVNSEQSRSQL